MSEDIAHTDSDYEPSPQELEALQAALKDFLEAEGVPIQEQGNISNIINTFSKWAGGKHSGCVLALRGKPGIENPDKLCAWLKDRATGKTTWRHEGKGKKESSPSPMQLQGVFLESQDASGTTWEVVIIREGWSANNRYYPREVLEAALPLFEGVPICMYGWYGDIGHLPTSIRQSIPEGLAGNVVGWVDNVHGVTSPDGRYEVRGIFHCTSDQLRNTLLPAWREGKRDLLGLSIDAVGESSPGIAEGRGGHIVRRISHVYEASVVTHPAAGGRYVRLIASEERKGYGMDKLREFLRPHREDVDSLSERELCEAVYHKLNGFLSEKALLSLVKEWIDQGKVAEASELLAKVLDELAPEKAEEVPSVPEEGMAMVMEARKKADAILSEAAKALERVRIRECETLLQTRLAESRLPEGAREKLRARFAGKVFEESELLKAIDEVREILAEAAPSPQVRIPLPDVQVGFETVDRLRAELDLVFDPDAATRENLSEAMRTLYRSLPRRPSLRRVYSEWYDDWDCSIRIGPNAIQEATTSDFATALGTSMERRMLRDYATLPQIWRTLANVVPVDNFKAQTRILWGGFGRLPTVAESTSSDYPELGFPREESSTYSVAKRGGLVTITYEMVVNDDLGALRKIPSRLARAAANEINYFLFSLLTGSTGGTINGDTIYDGLAIYHANHRNYTTNALSHSNFVSARAQIENQFEFGFSCLVNMAGGVGTGAQTITVDNPGSTGLQPGDLVQIEAEIMRVATVPSSTTFTVTAAGRGLYGTTDTSHPDNSRVYQLAGPLMLSKIYAIVPYELEGTLQQVLNSERVPGSANNDINFLAQEVRAGRIVPMPVPAAYLGADTNNWYLAADPSEVETIEIGFLGGKEEPEILVQDAPTVGNVFARDNIKYKLRHIYGGVVVDFRGLQGNIVA